jgi:hypothetical protein
LEKLSQRKVLVSRAAAADTATTPTRLTMPMVSSFVASLKCSNPSRA